MTRSSLHSEMTRSSLHSEMTRSSLRSEMTRSSLRSEMTRSSRSSLPTASMPMPVEVEEPTSDTSIDPDRPWVVIVWNDPINLMSYVSMVLQKLFGYSHEKADQLMLEVHNDGKSVVSQGTREKAELDVFRLHEHGLWATMAHDK